MVVRLFEPGPGLGRVSDLRERAATDPLALAKDAARAPPREFTSSNAKRFGDLDGHRPRGPNPARLDRRRDA